MSKKITTTNYNGEIIFAVERFMIKRGYAPICRPDSSVKSWQKKGNHNAPRISTDEAERMMINYVMRSRYRRHLDATRKRRDWE